MEGLVYDLKRNPDKDVMVSNPQVVEKGMIVDRIDGVENDKLGSFLLFYCASPHAMMRRELWHFLSSLVGSMEGPWMLASDFKSILDGGERKGGASISCVGGLSQRLDKAICNLERDSFLSECSVRNLHRLKI
ncbi:hypothetical protein GOBAR_AA03380 [Gossypium barbadense]|uniref:Uncharacterized protein n=1 Tax=Gossypium barbadense TaxID=3634 RepID=A0A2P5YNM4_GOSBA|nr:hypothetical protein GOBAR_AA03380 [Gossypium barbadense]